MEYDNKDNEARDMFDMLEQAVPSMRISSQCMNAWWQDAFPSRYQWVAHGMAGAVTESPAVVENAPTATPAAKDVLRAPAYTVSEMLQLYRQHTGISEEQESTTRILANAMARYLVTLEDDVAAIQDVDVTGPVSGRLSDQSVLSYNWCVKLFRTFPNSGVKSESVWLSRKLTGTPVHIVRRSAVTQEELDQYRVIPAYGEHEINACIQPHDIEWKRVQSPDDVHRSYVLITIRHPTERIPQMTYRSPVFPYYARLDGLAYHWLNVYRLWQKQTMKSLDEVLNGEEN